MRIHYKKFHYQAPVANAFETFAQESFCAASGEGVDTSSSWADSITGIDAISDWIL